MNEENAIYAGLVPRGLAYFLDCVIAFVFFAATQVLLFTPVREALNIGEEWFYSGANTELYTLLTISLPVWLYFVCFEQSIWQATIGKRVMKLQVVNRADGHRIGLGQSLVRTVVKLLPWELAHVVNNFPQPLMYATEPEFRLGFIGVGLLLGAYMAFVGLTKRKQGLHDLAAKTVVLKTVG